jgi:hypothetical protein
MMRVSERTLTKLYTIKNKGTALKSGSLILVEREIPSAGNIFPLLSLIEDT